MRNQGLTIVETIVIIFMVGFLGLVVLSIIGNRSVSARSVKCKETLSQIGKVMVAYTQDNGGYFPFAWGPANGTCSHAPGSTDACDAGTSLGCLYPEYINAPRVFRCSSTEDQPSFVVNTPQGAAWSQRNWTLRSNQAVSVTDANIRACSYGYDPRISPAAISNMAIMGDWDGSWQANPDISTQNHDGGQNVLYVDGSAKWKRTNYCSNDPIDNIYIEGGDDGKGKRVYWSADTDVYLVNGSAVLTQSYNGYPSLQR